MRKETARRWVNSFVLLCAIASPAIAAEQANKPIAVESATVAPNLPEQSPATPAPKPLQFVFITPCVREPFFEPVARGARDAAAMLDVRCDFRGTPDVDIPAQVELTRQAIDEGVDDRRHRL